MGAVSAQSRRTDAGNGDRRRARLHVPHLRARHQARLNLGIRRRLAPLLGNDRKRIELLNALLFSLPGTPVLYYGDEIGMGDNIYLGDRNGVRTPMQWSSDQNAGFSRANPQSLYLPIILDPGVSLRGGQRGGTAAQPAFAALVDAAAARVAQTLAGIGRRQMRVSPAGKPEHSQLTSCATRHETLLVVANLSRFVQPVELDLSAFTGSVPVELFGRTEFPIINERPYFLDPQFAFLLLVFN